ncbi:hypothetical protein, partial [Lactobacillus delbrueckii]|uniref:hypothetical protein n=3 Tax=Lactobacillus delbrueckii TaxID=1584 RepID=UPI001F1EEFA5
RTLTANILRRDSQLNGEAARFAYDIVCPKKNGIGFISTLHSKRKSVERLLRRVIIQHQISMFYFKQKILPTDVLLDIHQ